MAPFHCVAELQDEQFNKKSWYVVGRLILVSAYHEERAPGVQMQCTLMDASGKIVVKVFVANPTNRQRFKYEAAVNLSKVSRDKAWDSTFGLFELCFNDIGNKNNPAATITLLPDSDDHPYPDEGFDALHELALEVEAKRKINLRLKTMSWTEPQTTRGRQ